MLDFVDNILGGISSLIEIILCLIFYLNLVGLAVKSTVQNYFIVNFVQRKKNSTVMEIDAKNLGHLIFDT